MIFYKILTPFTQSNADESGRVDRSFEGNSLKVMQVLRSSRVERSDISQNFDTIHTK